MDQRTPPASTTANVLRKLAKLRLSSRRMAPETAAAERTAAESDKAKAVAASDQLERSEMASETAPTYKRRRGVEGRTKRCLYLLARASVAAFRLELREEGVEDNRDRYQGNRPDEDYLRPDFHALSFFVEEGEKACARCRHRGVVFLAHR